MTQPLSCEGAISSLHASGREDTTMEPETLSFQHADRWRFIPPIWVTIGLYLRRKLLECEGTFDQELTQTLLTSSQKKLIPMKNLIALSWVVWWSLWLSNSIIVQLHGAGSPALRHDYTRYRSCHNVTSKAGTDGRYLMRIIAPPTRAAMNKVLF